MTKGDLNGFRVLNRPVKPVAFGLSFLMVTIAIINVLDLDHFLDNVLGDLIAIMAAASGGLLIAGWFGKQQWAAEYGLLSAATVYIIRGTFIGLMYGLSDEELLLSYGTAIIAGGAFLLERLDSHPTRAEWFMTLQKTQSQTPRKKGG